MATGLYLAGGLPTQRVGRYVLRRWLAQGGMAELFLATPAEPMPGLAAQPSQIVVVKRVLQQFSQDPQFARMFAREAQLASALKHPNIVEVFESQAEGTGECFFAMEYVHGPDLAEVLRTLKDSGGSIPISHALTLAAGICAGLEHAHEQRDETGQPLGIVHRDVSPSNVMIAHDGTIKIMDFGVAKALALTSFTQAGTRKGKLSYMSPEQAVADPVDRRTDVFAIGAVLFELTTMQRMLGGDNELAVMHKLLFRERPKPSEIKAGYPIELEKIVLKAVAQSPADRFQTAGAMQQSIEDFARRNNIRLSATALAQWVATVIPPKPHPATDPEFFAAPTPPVASTPGGSSTRETTLAEGVGPHTLAGRGASEDVTALDGPWASVRQGEALPTAVGHLVAAEPESAVAQYVPLAPSGVVIVHPDMAPIGPAPVPARPPVSAVPGVRTSHPAPSKSGAYPRARASSGAGVGVIIAVAGVIAATVVLAALWYTRGTDRTPPANPRTVAPATVGAPADPPKTDPVAQPPTPVLAPENPPPPTPTIETPPTPVPVLQPTVETEVPPPAGDPGAVTSGRKKKDRGAPTAPKKKTEDKPPPETKATPPVTNNTPPPPPPPPGRRKDRPRTDTLLPPSG